MKYLTLYMGIFVSSSVFSAGAPTSVGNINIGMNKVEYQSAIGITPADCNTSKDREGKPNRSELKYLTPEKKTLCWSFALTKTGSTESIQIGNISYDVVEANYESSKVIESIGHSSKAIFFKDRLISFEIYAPKVSLETLTAKYGPAKFSDTTKVDVCKNRLGNEFKNKVGNIDAVWSNGDVAAILRTELKPPRNTCTDGLDMRYYIIEERKQLEPIEAAIHGLQKENAKMTAKDSPF